LACDCTTTLKEMRRTRREIFRSCGEAGGGPGQVGEQQEEAITGVAIRRCWQVDRPPRFSRGAIKHAPAGGAFAATRRWVIAIHLRLP